MVNAKKQVKTKVIIEPSHDEPTKPAVVAPKVDVEALRGVMYSTDLKAMQDAVGLAVTSDVDALTLSAKADVMKANSCGIASQYVQQIIARHGR